MKEEKVKVSDRNRDENGHCVEISPPLLQPKDVKLNASDVVLTQTPSRVSARPNGDISFKCSASQDIGWSLAWYHMPYGQTPRLLIKAGDEHYTASDVVLTQTPNMVSARLGGDVSFKCSASKDIGWYLSWYHMTLGQAPRLLIKLGNELYTGVPSRFSGQRSGSDFTLTITGVQAEDIGHYYCSSAQITLTQPQTAVTGHPGETVTIKCQTSSSIYSSQWKVDMLLWVHERPGMPRRGLLYDAVRQMSGVPSRFSGSGGGNEFTLTITGVQPEDAGIYFCGQYQTTQCTVTES
ncbi:KV12 protein, partial [Polypterus senegalus]